MPLLASPETVEWLRPLQAAVSKATHDAAINDSSLLRNQLRLVGELADAARRASFEIPTENSIEAACYAVSQLWSDELVPSAIVPAADGGVGISIIRGSSKAHLEFTNDGELVVLLTRPGSSADVLSYDSQIGSTEALQHIRAYFS